MSILPAANPDAPHVALLVLGIHLYEQRPSGELSGIPLKEESVLLRVAGADRAACEAKLAALVADLKEKTRE